MKKVIIVSALLSSLLFLALMIASCGSSTGGGSKATTPYIYCGSENDQSILVINGSNNTTVEVISLTGDPFNMAATPDGKKIYCATDSDQIIPIDTGTNLPGTPITVPNSSRSRGMAVSHNGEYLYLTSGSVSTPEFIRVDLNETPVTYEVLSLPRPAGRIALNSDSTKAFICTNDPYTSLLTSTPMSIYYSINLKNHPWDIAIKGNHAFLALSSAIQVVARVNLGDYNAVDYIETDPNPVFHGIAGIPGQDKLYISDDRTSPDGKIWIVSSEVFALEPDQITSTELASPRLMAATSKYAYVVDGASEHCKIAVIDVENGEIECFIYGLSSDAADNNPVVIYK